jgi:hypothetical protein
MFPEREILTLYSSCSDGTGMDSIKSSSRLVMPNFCFCIRWDLHVTLCIPVHPGRETSIYYFSCSIGTSTDSTKSALGHIMSNLCFLHPVASAGHVA